MSKVSIEVLQKAFSQFSKMYNHYTSEIEHEGSIEQEAIKESLVQRFEYTVELSWKTLARYMLEYLGLEVLKAPKPIFREAGRLEILETEAWLSFIDCRNIASHTYNEKTLDTILAEMDNFYIHAKNLLEYLEKNIED